MSSFNLGGLSMNNHVRFSRLLLLLTLALLTTHCGSSESEEDTNKRLGFGPTAYDIGDCQQSPSDGHDYEVLNFQGAPQSTGYFNKNFTTTAFEEALTASSYSIVEALYFDQNVNVYRVPDRRQTRCQYFEFIFEAPSVYEQKWNEVQGQSPSGGRLLGLFSTIYEKNSASLQVKLTKPTILLRADTEKWTLIHEMTHYLFAKNRSTQIDMPFPRDLQLRALQFKQQAREAKEKFDTRPRPRLAQQLVSAHQNFWKVNLDLDSQTALEEFTIESLLVEKLQSGQITGVNPSVNMQQAYFYMSFSAREVTHSYRRFLQELESIDLSAFPGANRKLTSLQQEVRQTLRFIKEKLELVTPVHQPFSSGQTVATDWESLEPDLYFHYDLEAFKNRHELMRNWD